MGDSARSELREVDPETRASDLACIYVWIGGDVDSFTRVRMLPADFEHDLEG